jgi:hypothetical protein
MTDEDKIVEAKKILKEMLKQLGFTEEDFEKLENGDYDESN